MNAPEEFTTELQVPCRVEAVFDQAVGILIGIDPDGKAEVTWDDYPPGYVDRVSVGAIRRCDW